MESREKATILFYPMVSFAKSIYENIHTLCELEKAGKKQERAYYNTLRDARQLLLEEHAFYRNNIDKIIDCRGELFYFVINNSSVDDKNRFDYLSEFDPNCIYERIKAKLKYHIGLRRSFGGDILCQLKDQSSGSKVISGSLLSESIITDIEKMSLFYMDNYCYDVQRRVDYKYLMGIISNLDGELIQNYFEISKNQMFTDSALIYGLSGLPDEIYRADFTNCLLEKFTDYVDYIVTESLALEDDNDYRTEIALNYLKSILDLLPPDVAEEFYNEYIMSISDDKDIPLDIRLRIVNAMRDASKGRKLLRQISVGTSTNWME